MINYSQAPSIYKTEPVPPTFYVNYTPTQSTCCYSGHIQQIHTHGQDSSKQGDTYTTRSQNFSTHRSQHPKQPVNQQREPTLSSFNSQAPCWIIQCVALYASVGFAWVALSLPLHQLTARSSSFCSEAEAQTSSHWVDMNQVKNSSIVGVREESF